ncbi:MAG: sensor histidine kinase, partial [Acidobacteria bacterium]|nr:sensor histidine kinase [Acidobacteriota bacterium]
MKLTPPSLSTILRIHALLTGASAALLLLRTPNSEYLAATPQAGWTILHIIGALFVVCAAFAYALSRSLDSFGLRAFLFAQWVALAVLLAKYHAVFDYKLRVEPLALFFVSVLLLTFWRLSYRDLAVPSLKKKYEQEIRRAAGQEERQRLARDLHDSIKQHIFAIQTAAATAQQSGNAPPAVEQIRESARDVMTELDAMMHSLHADPLTMAGLVDAVNQLAETTRLRTGAAVTVAVHALPPDESVPPGTAHALMRILQEALSNCARHARPTSVAISLRGGETLVLEVTDDGSGFDADLEHAGMGLRNIRARAEELGGSAKFESEKGKGTRLSVETPMGGTRANRKSLLIAAALVGAFLFLTANTNPLHPLLIHALRGALAIFIVLHFIGRRRAAA